jgi:hypothetical protein
MNIVIVEQSIIPVENELIKKIRLESMVIPKSEDAADQKEQSEQ